MYLYLYVIDTLLIKENLKLNIFNNFLIKLNNFSYNIIILFLINSLIIQNYKKINSLIAINIVTLYLSNNYILLNFFTGYYKIHPIIFYISFHILLNFLIKKKIIKNNFIMFFLLSILAFILGSLWALKQTIWGKYWSSDYIEIILIFNIILLSYYFHLLKNNNKIINFFFFSTVVIILIFLRLNLLYTKHSFFNQKKNVYIYTLSYILMLFNNIHFKIFNKFSLKTSKYKFFIYVFFLIVLLNKLNIIFIQFFIKTLIYNLFLSLFLNILIINKNFLIHFLFYSIILIFFFFSTTFYKISILIENNLLKNNSFFLYYKKDYNKYFYNILKFKNIFKKDYQNYVYLKNKNNFYFFKNKIIKMLNYF